MYTDVDQLSAWAADAMKWSVAQGLISGKGQDILDPAGATSHSQGATILMRFYEMMEK